MGNKQRKREMIQAELGLEKPLDGDGGGHGTQRAGDEGERKKRARTTDEPHTGSLYDVFLKTKKVKKHIEAVLKNGKINEKLWKKRIRPEAKCFVIFGFGQNFSFRCISSCHVSCIV